MSSSPPPMQVLPVTPSYQSFPQYPQRPGIVTAMGVIGIVIASLSFVLIPIVAITAVGSLVAIQAQRQRTSAGDAMMYPLVPDPIAAQSLNGVDAQKAGFVVEALGRTRPLTPTRASHVRTLALMHGQQLFPFGAEGMTVLRMKANITESGPLLAGVGKTGDYYVTGSGRIEVTDQSAIFRPDNGPTVRSSDLLVDRSLPEDQIDAVLVRIQWLGQTDLSESQAQTIRKLLRDPQQSVLTPPADVAAAGKSVSSVGPMQDGGIWFVTGKAQVRIARDGKETLLNTFAPVPGTNPQTGRPAQSIWGQMVLVAQAASLGLAIVMMIWSIGLLRGKPSARRLALIWAVLKLPVAIVASIMLGMMTAEWIAVGQQVAINPTPADSIGWQVGAVAAVLGIAWPITVLVVINRRSVKDWVALSR